jgi:glutaconate CoA-transferase subunit A
MSHFKRYVASAAEPGGWQAYMEEFVQAGEATYRSRTAASSMAALPLPVF